MNRVLGSAIKAGVAISVAKQIAAGGKRMTTLTRWSGKTAYAAWATDWSPTCVINYPLLSDDALLTRVEADLIAAYTLHETGHILFTTRVGLAGDMHAIWNGIEDGWMENQVIAFGQAKNAKQLFTRLLNKLTHDLPESFNPCQWSDAPFALAILCRQAFGNGNAFSASLLDRIPEPKRGLYETVMQEVLASGNSLNNAVLAEAFAKGFAEIDAAKSRVQADAPSPPPPPPPPPSDDYWKDDGEEETPAQDGNLEDSDEIVEAPEQVGSDDKQVSLPSDEDGEDDEDGDEPAYGQASDDEQDDWQDDGRDDGRDGEQDGEQDGEAESGDEPSDESDDLSGDGDAESDDGDEAIGDGPAGQENGSSFSDDESNGEKARSPEPNIDDVVNRAHKRSAQKGQLPQYTPASRIPNEREKFVGDEFNFGPTPGALKTQLSRLLLSVDRIGWDSGATSGRFDVRRTSRMMAGSERVFKKRWETEAISSRVTILVDMSGSMEWSYTQSPIGLCSDVAYALAETCERVGCAVEVVGFKDAYCDTTQRVRDLSGKLQKSGSSYSDHSSLTEYKRFDQRVRDAKKSLYSIRNDADGCTPDAHALRTCVETMGISNENRRLVLVLTDGFGSPSKVRDICNVAPKRGVTVIGVGILTDPRQMAEAYPVSACASSLTDLSTVAIRSLIKQLG